MIPSWLAAARAVHFGSCLLLLATCVFDRFMAEGGPPWRSIARWLCFIALPLALASGVLWLCQVTISMSGESLRANDLSLVWNQTRFGFLWQIRLCIWILLTAAMIWAYVPIHSNKLAAWLALIFSAGVVGSLAWSGHGQYGRPAAVHLAADCLHLLIAGCWPAGLAPLALFLFISRSAPPKIIRRFSIMSLGSVALLAATGTINSCFMLNSFRDFIWTTYGRVLMVKIVLFAIMIGFGAVNLLRLKPKLDFEPRAAIQLKWNVTAEGVLFLVLIVVVSILGLLMPPMP